MLDWALATMADASPIDRLVVVLGANADAIAARVELRGVSSSAVRIGRRGSTPHCAPELRQSAPQVSKQRDARLVRPVKVLEHQQQP